MRWSTARWLLAAFTFLAGLGLSAKADEDKGRDEGFKPLFNGTDLTGWKFRLQGDADPKKTFSVKDGVIVVTGRPNGFFYTDKSYKDYVLRFDWRYKRPKDLTDDSKFLGNSGCLVHIHHPDKGVVGGV